MRNFQTDRFLFLATEEASPTRLAQGHSRRLGFVPTFRYSSTFLRPFAPSPLRDFFATMDALTPASSALRSSTSNMNTVSVRRQVSLIHVSDLPIPPSPTTPQALDADFSRYPSSRRVSHCRGSRFHLSLAGSPTLTGRIEFLIVRMDRSPPVAPHPASRRRSYSWLQAGERIPEEDFHLSNQTRRPASPRPATTRTYAT